MSSGPYQPPRARPEPTEASPAEQRSHSRSVSSLRDAQSPLAAGEVVAGKYRIERTLGAGGMGVVVVAQDIELERRVAIKFLHASASANAEAASRFKREARAMAKLHSEHVVRVLDVGALPSGLPYMVMEYLEGIDMAHVSRDKGPLPISDVADYVLQACEAMAEAHAQGIVHRDLKPSNMFLARRRDGTKMLKLLDFGIAKMETDNSEVAQSLTTTTALLGSPIYMSPEQLQCSRDADARADIWSLGAIMQRLLTGRPPFLADTLPQVCTLIMSADPPPVREARPDAPPEMEAAVRRCLQKDPGARYPDVGELAKAMVPFASQRLRPLADRAAAMIRGTSDEYTGSVSALLVQSVKAAEAREAAEPSADPVSASKAETPAVDPELAERIKTRNMILGAAGLSVTLGFVIGLVFWLASRPTPPTRPVVTSAQQAEVGTTTAAAPPTETAPAVAPPPPETAIAPPPPAVLPAVAAPPPPAQAVVPQDQGFVPVAPPPPPPPTMPDPAPQQVQAQQPAVPPPRPYVPPRRPRPPSAQPAPRSGDDTSEFGGRK